LSEVAKRTSPWPVSFHSPRPTRPMSGKPSGPACSGSFRGFVHRSRIDFLSALRHARPPRTTNWVSADIHTSNAFRGYALGRLAHERGAFVVFGGIHATFPDEAHQHGAAHSVVRGDGDIAWGEVLEDCASGRMKPVYEGGRIAGAFRAARWDLLPRKRCRTSSTCF